MIRRDGDLDDRVTRVDKCAHPNCLRLTTAILCAKHRRELARLDTERDHDDEPPPRAA